MTNEPTIQSQPAESARPQGEWATMPLVVIDFETTGLSAENDRVVEMGVAVFNDGELVESKNWLVNPEMPVPEAASAVHGITDAMLADAPTFVVVLDEALPMLTGRLPMAYNAPFDRAFLRAEFARLGREVPEGVHALDESTAWIDPLVWVREIQKYDKGKKLTDAARRLRIDLTNAHRAESDAVAAGRVMLELAKRNRISERIPTDYRELLTQQTALSGRQESDFAAWKARQAQAVTP
jgi:DNA polymerase III subunit epsilon